MAAATETASTQIASVYAEIGDVVALCDSASVAAPPSLVAAPLTLATVRLRPHGGSDPSGCSDLRLQGCTLLWFWNDGGSPHPRVHCSAVHGLPAGALLPIACLGDRASAAVVVRGPCCSVEPLSARGTALVCEPAAFFHSREPAPALVDRRPSTCNHRCNQSYRSTSCWHLRGCCCWHLRVRGCWQIRIRG